MRRRRYPPQPIASVGVVVLKGDEVLLVRRGHEPRQGEWSIPGGVIELGETIKEAARREVKEECGLDIRVGRVLDVIDAIYGDEEGRIRYHYVLVDMAATYLNGELKAGSDVEEARWVKREELHRLSLPEKTRAVILKALEEGGESQGGN